MLVLVLAVLVLAVFGLRGFGRVPPAVGDTTLSAQLAAVPPVDLRGPDNPVFDPRVLNDFWDSATVRAATPLVARPAAPPLVASPPAPAEGPPAPSLPALLQEALLARGPVLSSSQGGRPHSPVLRASPHPVPTIAAAPDLPVRDGQLLAARVTGRLFFTLTGQPHSCTATVISSGSGSILATAGHCLLADLESTPAGESRAQVANLLFGPGFHDGLFPYGRWVVTSVHIAAG